MFCLMELNPMQGKDTFLHFPFSWLSAQFVYNM